MSFLEKKMVLLIGFIPILASIIARFMGYDMLSFCLIVIAFAWNITMFFRNNWLYTQYLQLFIKEAYKKDQFDYEKQYDVLLLKVWIIDVRKYIDKTVECSMKK